MLRYQRRVAVLKPSGSKSQLECHSKGNTQAEILPRNLRAQFLIPQLIFVAGTIGFDSRRSKQNELDSGFRYTVDAFHVYSMLTRIMVQLYM